ncbi:Predicted protein [bacterium A37T11]|nr:Predicted protein [bacterium A37T11]
MERLFYGLKLASLLFYIIISFAYCAKSDGAVNDVNSGGTPLQEKPDTSELTKIIFHKTDFIKDFLSDTVIQITNGLQETRIDFIKKSGSRMKMLILKVDLKQTGLGLQALVPFGEKKFGRQPITQMAASNEKAGTKILAAINGDFFNLTTGEPQSVLVVDGVVLKETRDTKARTFVGTYPDGTLVLGGLGLDGKEMDVDFTRLQQAVGGNERLIIDHKRALLATTSLELDEHPRTAIGYTDDRVLYALVIDGRQMGWSMGTTVADLQDIFYALNTYMAINMDGGGSTTLALRKKEIAQWVIQNKPSDGSERAVGDGLGIVLKERYSK